MKYALLVDTNKCCLCFSCVVACKDEFVGNIYPPYSYPQPDRGQEWISLSEIEKGKYPQVKVYAIPVLCMHCADAPCMKSCPVPDCISRNDKGVVIIDPEKCDGCKACIDACPYGVIFLNEDKNICQKCTLCSHRLEKGKEPACVDACPSGVFTFGEESDLLAEIKKIGARVFHPEYKTSPRIYYVGLPSATIAGHIIDSNTLMDVPGAEVTISNHRSNVSRKSNTSGNFLADELKRDTPYSVKIECQGYKPRVFEAVNIDIDYKHLGDIKLNKA